MNDKHTMDKTCGQQGGFNTNRNYTYTYTSNQKQTIEFSGIFNGGKNIWKGHTSRTESRKQEK